ncbi:hypothetical protein PENTCL1PPCAC_1604, partial [Pristionchus entomophagus]
YCSAGFICIQCVYSVLSQTVVVVVIVVVDPVTVEDPEAVVDVVARSVGRHVAQQYWSFMELEVWGLVQKPLAAHEAQLAFLFTQLV